MAKKKGSEQTLVALFKMVWIRSNKRSFISGLHLRDFIGGQFELNMFAHVLSKKQYPHFKFFAYNISLLHPEEHKLWDFGTEDQRVQYSLDMEEKTNGRVKADWDKLMGLESELKDLYKKFFPTTYQGIINYKYSPEEVIEIIGKLNKEFFHR